MGKMSTLRHCLMHEPILHHGSIHKYTLCMQVGYHASAALQQYFWSNLVVAAAAARKRLPAGSITGAKQVIECINA